MERKWKGDGIQFLGLNNPLMHKMNHLLFKQMSMSTYKITQTWFLSRWA